MIRLADVHIDSRTRLEVDRILKQGMIGQSHVIDEFERVFSNYLGVNHCVAVSSGTMADTIALAVLKHFNPGKTEVIVPCNTFIAQVNAIVYNGLTPVFVDVLPDGNMNVPLAEEKMNQKTLCLYPAHILGKPADLLSLSQMCRAFKVRMVEDSCEALGSEYSAGFTGFKKCGSFGDMGTFSFYPSHTMTTGEGGMIATDNEEFAEAARKIRNHGRMDSPDFVFQSFGFNGKMSSLQAAVGIGQLRHLPKSVEKRMKVYALYGRKDTPEMKTCPHAVSFDFGSQRDAVLARLRSHGIECRKMFPCIPFELPYRHLGYSPEKDFLSGQNVADRQLYVPSHETISQSDVERVMEILYEKAVLV